MRESTRRSQIQVALQAAAPTSYFARKPPESGVLDCEA
jgi:hypothetical protein